MKTERQPLLRTTWLGRLGWLGWLATASIAGCNERATDRCECQGECDDGRVCAVGNTVLGAGRCAEDLLEASGRCVVPDENLADDPLVPEPHFDLGHWVSSTSGDRTSTGTGTGTGAGTETGTGTASGTSTSTGTDAGTATGTGTETSQ